MTGPEHYREAERLIRPYGCPSSSNVVVAPAPEVTALAQVHATLALAAATATTRGNADPYDWLAWNKTLGGTS
jgi:hypothetical protein